MQAEPRPKKLLDQVRDAVHLKHYSYRTEQTYVQWIRRVRLSGDVAHFYTNRCYTPICHEFINRQ